MMSRLDLFFQGYLFALVFWLGLPLGSLALLMIHALTGGRWGEKISPYLQAASGGLWILAFMFVPICLCGLPHLYPWATLATGHAQKIYLTASFFCARTVFYFLVWLICRHFFLNSARKEFWACVGLISFALTVSFASIDWIMSLEAGWSSTLFGLLNAIGMVLGALSFCLFRMAFSQKQNFKSSDFGNLLLTFVMVWAYFSFSQFLIMWMGNLPEEVVWYDVRTHRGWGVFAVVLIMFQFMVPFILLLFRKLKTSSRILGLVALTVLVTHAIDLFWTILPSVRPDFTVHLSDAVFFAGVGLIWFYTPKIWRKEAAL